MEEEEACGNGSGRAGAQVEEKKEDKERKWKRKSKIRKWTTKMRVTRENGRGGFELYIHHLFSVWSNVVMPC